MIGFRFKLVLSSSTSTTCLLSHRRLWFFIVTLLIICGGRQVDCTNANMTDVDQDMEACYAATLDPAYASHPDKHLKAPDIIKRHGFPVEVHNVTSEDGYHLELHRIPHSTAFPPGTGPKTPVYLQHGIMASSVNWILPPVEKALAYRIANMGYDVWLGNVRGSTYSLKHKDFDHTHKKYWDFSWHEMGYYDIPATIDYILKATNHTQLTYIGHSMGCTMFFVCMSERPEYNKKVETMFALAPVAYVENASSFFKFVAPFSYNWEPVYDFFGRGQLIPEYLRMIMNPVMATSCNMHPAINCHICSPLYFLLFNSDGKQMNYTMLPVITQHFPDRVSSRTIIHYGQNLVTRNFQQFDTRYAIPNWLKRFFPDRGPPPPKYNLTRITVPIVLFYADRDNLADPKDVARLTQELPNVKAKVKVCYPYFNHNDFLFGINVNELVYDKLITILGGDWDVDFHCEKSYINETTRRRPSPS